MASLCPPLSAEARASLLEFERLHAQWRLASEAADRCEHASCGRSDLRQLLRLRLDADHLHHAAMQLLRERPL